jgi:glutamyl-Q tRNA(Asp) synthetase
VFAAWFARSRARERGGRFLLRLEDIDRERARPEYAAALQADLVWLGLAWDGEVLVQSQHRERHAAALAALRDRGLVYPCFCSRADVLRELACAAGAPHGPDGAPLYPGTCKALGSEERLRRIAAGAAHAWRLDMARAAPLAPALSYQEEGRGRVACAPARFGDVVLWRREGGSYHLCATADDAWQGVTLVTRGEDLRDAADLHRLLQCLMGWPEPAYAHHRLLTDAQGRRLAKRDAAAGVDALRASGCDPARVLALAGCGSG